MLSSSKQVIYTGARFSAYWVLSGRTRTLYVPISAYKHNKKKLVRLE